MKNREQIRAEHALRFWDKAHPTPQQGRERVESVQGENGGDVVRGLSALIINSGLLATVSFAEQKGKGYATFAKEIARFLMAPTETVTVGQAAPLSRFVNDLTSQSSLHLQRRTAEALAYLGYLKRFALKAPAPTEAAEPQSQPVK